MRFARLFSTIALVVLFLSGIPAPVPAAPFVGPVRIGSVADLLALPGASGSGTEDDPWLVSDLEVEEPNGTALTLSGISGHVVLRNLKLAGRVLLSASDVTNLTIDGLRGNATEEGALIRNVTDLTLRNWELRAPVAGLFLASIGHVDSRFVNVTAQDGVFMTDVRGEFYLSTLRVEHNGLMATGFDGILQNVNVLGCSGTGFQILGGDLRLIGNGADCHTRGFHIVEAESLVLEGNAAGGAQTGFLVVDGASVTSEGDVARNVGTGFHLSETTATLKEPQIEGADVGILLEGGTATVDRLRATRVGEAAVRAVGTALTEGSGKLQSVALGYDFVSATVFPIPGGAPSVVTDAGLGARFSATSAPAPGWWGLDIQECEKALDVKAGTDAVLDTLDVDACAKAGTVSGGGKLDVRRGKWGHVAQVGTGFRVIDGSILKTANIDGFREIDGTFVEANDSRVEDTASNIWTEKVAFDVRDGVLRLKDTNIRNAEIGVRIKGVLPVPAEEDLEHSSLEGVRVGFSKSHSVHLSDTIAEIRGGTFEDAGKVTGGQGHGIFAEQNTALVVVGAEIIDPRNDGIHWTGLAGIPRSTLFPPDDGGFPTGRPRFENVVVRDADEDGIHILNVPKAIDFAILGSEFRNNNGYGALLRDVVVDIADSAFGNATLVRFPGFCVGECLVPQGNDKDGLHARWTDAPGEDRITIRNSRFMSNLENGVTLAGFGEGTRIEDSIFQKNGGTDLTGSEGVDDLLHGHAVFIPESRGAGPLLKNNFMGDSFNCQVRSNGNVRVVENHIVHNGSSPACGVLVKDASSAQVHGNRIEKSGIGIALLSTSGSVVGNFANDTTMGALWVVGTGSQTVTASDNTFESLNGGTLVAFCILDCLAARCINSIVCWSNTQGAIQNNVIDTPPATFFGFYTQRNLVIFSGPSVPVIERNNLTSFGQAIMLYDDTSFGTPGTTQVGRFYDGANLIRNNRITATTRPGGGIGATGVFDAHGGYHKFLSDPQYHAHEAPLGANVQNNDWLPSLLVECHDFEVENSDGSTSYIRDDYPCAAGGVVAVLSHNFAGSASGPSGPRSPPDYPKFTDIPTRERARYSTQERPPGFRQCGGFVLAPILDFHADLRGNSARDFGISATVPWKESIPYRGVNCDALADIKVRVESNGEVIHETTAAAIADHRLEFSHVFPAETLSELVLTVRLDSKAEGAGPQRHIARDAAWSSTVPRVRELKIQFGSTFLQSVPVPSGVELRATVLWGTAQSGQVGEMIWKAGGKEWKTRHIISPRLEPTTSFQPGFVESAASLTVTSSVAAQARVKSPEGPWLESNAETTRLKLIPFPAGLALFFLPAETEAQRVFNTDGSESLAYKWEWTILKGGNVEFKTALPVIAGKYESEFSLGAKMTAQTTGGGSFGIQGGAALEGQPESGRLEFAGSIKVDANGLVQVDDIDLTGVSLVLKPELDVTVFMFASDLVPPFKAAVETPGIGYYLRKVDKAIRLGGGIGLEAEATVRAEWDEGARCGGLRDGWKCSGEVVAKPRATLKLIAEVGDDVLGAEAYGKGSFLFTWATAETAPPGDLLDFQKWGAELEAGLELQFFEWERAWKLIVTVETASPPVGGSFDEDSGWRIPERTWTDGGTFRGADAEVLANLTKNAAPSVAFGTDTVLAVWVKDDLSAEYPRSGQIAAAHRSAAGVWQDLGILSTDGGGLLDARPSVAPIFGGKYVVAWSRDVNATLSRDAPLDAQSGRTLETMAVVVDPALTTQATPTRLTNDDRIDAGVQVVTGADTRGAVVWRKLAASLMEPGAEELWAARVAATGEISPAVRILDNVTADALETSWGSNRLWLAESTAGNLTLRSTDLATMSAPVLVATTGDVPPVVALRADNSNRFVTYLRVNATNPSRFDLVETQVSSTGAIVTTRPVARDVMPAGLSYAAGNARELLWVERGLEGDRLLRSVLSGTWTAPEELAKTPNDMRLLAAKGGPAPAAILHERLQGNATRTFPYTGPNSENPGETVTFERQVGSVQRGVGSLRYLPIVPARKLPDLAPLVVEQILADAANGTARIRATIANAGTNLSAPRAATLDLAPWGASPVARVAVTLPPIPAGARVTFSTDVPLPEGDGWWSVALAAEATTGATGVLRLAPEWRLPQSDVDREGDVVGFRLVNAGPRGGDTLVRAYELRADGSLGPSLAESRLAVGSGSQAFGSLTLPTGTGTVLLVANPSIDGAPVDQGDFSETMAIAEGPIGLFDFAGELTLAPGEHPFRLDLSRFAGANFALSTKLDGVPISFQTVGGVVTGNVALLPGDHTIEVLAQDVLGAPRRLVLLVHAKVAGSDGPGDGGSDGGTGGGAGGDGTGGDGTPANETPPASQPWYAKIAKFFGIPSATPAWGAFAVAAAALLARRRAKV